MATAVHNIGLADWLTIGFQAEGAKDLGMAGAGVQRQLSRLGTFGAEGWPARRRERTRLCRDRRLLLGELVRHRDPWDVDRAEVPESVPAPANLAQVNADGSVSRRSARLVRSPPVGRWAGRTPTARISQIDPESSDDSPIGENEPAGCTRDPAR